MLFEKYRQMCERRCNTSIMISDQILSNDPTLTLLKRNSENSYYLVHGTNIVIMHVMDGKCIIIDYQINGKRIVDYLSNNHYAVYYQSRDWVRNTKTKRLIGYDIKDITGERSPGPGYELDHAAETFNELNRNKRFIPKVKNRGGGSHKRGYIIEDQSELEWLIKRLQELDDQPLGTFL